MSKSRKRAVAPPHGNVGGHRYTGHARIRDQVDAALAAGFPLEAITLIESVLADRRESRASYLTGADQGFSTLGHLIKVLRAEGVDDNPDFRSTSTASTHGGSSETTHSTSCRSSRRAAWNRGRIGRLRSLA